MEKISSRQTDLSSYDNSWYQPGGKIKIICWYILSRVFINTYLPFPMILKIFILRLFGAKVAATAVIKPKVNIKYPWNLEIQDFAWIGENVWIDNLEMVTFGTNCCVSQGAMLLTGNHDFTKSNFELIVKPIILKAGVWIGAKAVVCPGVVAESHAILTVNSVATKSLEPYGIYQGNPAKFVKLRNISN